MIQALGKTALLFKGLRLRSELPVQEAAGYCDENQCGVGGDLGIGGHGGLCGRPGVFIVSEVRVAVLNFLHPGGNFISGGATSVN